MRLNRLLLKNFRQHADTRIDFDSGLTGIIGPNGSGKSTILEAIAWALYGTPAARGTREGIRWLRAPARSGVKVDLEFDLAGHRYRVVRSMSSAELYLDGSSAPIANSLTAVSDLLRRRLGMSQQEFFNTYFTGQKELSVMAAMGPAERAQFLSRVLGYERLRGAQALVRERRSVLKGELAGLHSAMPERELVAQALADTATRLADAEARAKDALRRLKKAHDAVSEVQPKWAAAQKEREALQEVAAELRVRESEGAAFVREVERLDRELEEIAAARKEAEQIRTELSMHADLAAQLHAMEALFRDEGKRQALLKSQRELTDELGRLRDRRDNAVITPKAFADAQAERDRLKRDLDQAAVGLEAARADWVRDKQKAATERENLLAQHKEVREQRDRLASLGPESPCPICTRPLADHFREVLDDLDGKMREIEVNGRYWAGRIEQLAEMPTPLADLERSAETLAGQLELQGRAVTELQLRAQEGEQLGRDVAEKERRLASIATEIASIPPGYHVTRHAELRHRHEQFAPMAARSARLGALTEREPDVRESLAKVKVEQSLSRKRATELRDRQAKSRFSEASFAMLRTVFDSASSELRSSELDGVAAEKELEAARAARAAAEKSREEMERAQQRERVLNADRRMHDELDRAFTDMRAELNQHLRPEISELASGFLAELTDGRYSELELDDDYNVIVLEDGVPKPVISGGEEDLANLVLRLAISQMIAERAGQAFSLLVLDEVFGSLDEARRHNVVELLQRLHDRFEQVVLITHIETVREGLDRVMTVRYDEESGASRVEAETVGAFADSAAAPGAYAAEAAS